MSFLRPAGGGRPGRHAGAPPRLVLRFVVVTAVGLVVAGAAIVVVLDHAFADHAQRQANDHAGYTVGAVVSPRLTAADFEVVTAPGRRRQLGRLFSSENLGSDTAGAALYDAAGTLSFARTPDGTVVSGSASAIRQALAGKVASRISNTADGKVLSTFLPARSRDGAILGVVRLDRDYGAAAAAARRTSVKVAAILEALLIVLCLFLLPVLSRSTARLRRHLEETEHIATHDELTGLLNGLGFRRELAKAADGQGEKSLLLIDLEKFRAINNSLGFGGGDALLREVADRLHTVVAGESLGRISGSEFGLVASTQEPSQLARLSDEIGQAFQEPIGLEGLRIELQPRIGVATIAGGSDTDDALRRASSALSHAKHHRHAVDTFDAAHDAAERERLVLTAELRDAVETGQLVVHYQPQADLTTRSIRGIEALVRWQHPRLGLLMPDAFLPLAEHQRLITKIDRQVLLQSIGDWAIFRDRGVMLDLAVNLSALDLLDADFPDFLEECLQSAAFPPEHLVLEITERSLLADTDSTYQALNRLSATGARLSIDDFGTGYSSLAYLYRMPFRQVKLDRGFITNLPDDPSSDAIIRATVNLSHTLNALVVAEGVETSTQWRHLRDLGCDIAQGFLVGAPQAPHQLLDRLTQRPGNPTLVAA